MPETTPSPMPEPTNIYTVVAAHSKKEYQELLLEADNAISELEREFPLRNNPHVLGVGYGLVYEDLLADPYQSRPKMTTGIRVYHARETDASAIQADLKRTSLASRINFVKVEMPQFFAATGGDGIRGALGTGTLGCVVQKAGTRYILSNSHVLGGTGNIGFRVDHTASGTSIATLSETVDIDYNPGSINDVDAAIAKIDPTVSVSTLIHSIGPIVSTVRAPLLHLSVRKHGMTTGHTVGVVMAVCKYVKIAVGTNTAEFNTLLEIQAVGGGAFGNMGDSGALVVDAVYQMPVGLFISGSATSCFAIPIQEVLNQFGVTVVP